MPAGAPIVRGSFAQTPLVQLLQHIFARKLSGLLHVGDHPFFEIAFARGVPISPRAVATLAEAAHDDEASFQFALGDADPPSSDGAALAAMLAVARATPRRGRFAAIVQGALDALGARPVLLRAGASIDVFAPTMDERLAIETARDLRLSLPGLIAADVAPADAIERLVYALGVAGRLDVGR